MMPNLRNDSTAPQPQAVPPRAGVGLKAEHYRRIVETLPDVGFFEAHAENYMGAGGPPHRYLAEIREHYPLSLHGVGLSIGADRPLDRDHLTRLKNLIARYEPALFSEHLAWSTLLLKLRRSGSRTFAFGFTPRFASSAHLSRP